MTPPVTPNPPSGVWAKVVDRFKRLGWGYALLGVIAFGVLGFIVWLMFFNKPKPPAAITATVDYADIEKTVLATGTLTPFVQINVGARASGTVTRLAVAVGDTVNKGDLVAVIDSAT